MKYILMPLVLIILIGCAIVNKKFIENNDTCHYNDSIFNIQLKPLKKSFIERLKKEKNITINDENFKNRYICFTNGHLLNIKTDKNINITRFISFYENGVIKRIRFECNVSNIGKETHYNKEGEIIKVIDHDKGYKICWAEAIEIIKEIAKREIKKHEVTGFNLTRVNLNKYPNSKPVWRITLDGNQEYEIRQSTKVYWIDGVTGKFIKTTLITTVP